jgi:hypothetical protein
VAQQLGFAAKAIGFSIFVTGQCGVGSPNSQVQPPQQPTESPKPPNNPDLSKPSTDTGQIAIDFDANFTLTDGRDGVVSMWVSGETFISKANGTIAWKSQNDSSFVQGDLLAQGVLLMNYKSVSLTPNKCQIKAVSGPMEIAVVRTRSPVPTKRLLVFPGYPGLLSTIHEIVTCPLAEPVNTWDFAAAFGDLMLGNTTGANLGVMQPSAGQPQPVYILPRNEGSQETPDISQNFDWFVVDGKGKSGRAVSNQRLRFQVRFVHR